MFVVVKMYRGSLVTFVSCTVAVVVTAANAEEDPSAVATQSTLPESDQFGNSEIFQ